MPNRLITFHSIRFKLIASLMAVSLLIGLISLLVGGNMLYRSVIDEAGNRIRHDLNVARVIYDDRIETIDSALGITVGAPGFKTALGSGDPLGASEIVMGLSSRLGLDFFGFTDENGRLLFSASEGEHRREAASGPNPFVRGALEKNGPVSGTVVLDRKGLEELGPSLPARAAILMRGTPGNGTDEVLTRGLTIGAAVPVRLGGKTVGIVYGGYLLNEDTAIVDHIGETVFRNEVYRGHKVGTATIFLGDIRIATSVKDPSGKRALGTSAAPDVARQVIRQGIKWTDRAMVLDDWYITAYEPLTDLSGNRVGMLYVGVLEAKYADVRKRAFTVFAAITMAGVIMAVVLGWLLTTRIMRPVNHMIRASGELSRGNFSPDIGPVSNDDIGMLQKEFLLMTEVLKEREERQKAESEIQLMQSQKQASVGRLAAGVAHEINNPLTGVLTFTHLLLRRKDLPAEVLEDLETVAAQTERVREIVKSLLDFSRQTEISPEVVEINGLIGDIVRLMNNQAHVKGVGLLFERAGGLPEFILDRNQLQSVMINMIINALDATPQGGRIEIQTRAVEGGEAGDVRVNSGYSNNRDASNGGASNGDASNGGANNRDASNGGANNGGTNNGESYSLPANGDGVEIIISDTGCGIAPEHMEKLFDPFFTTKEVGKGTGLGLAVSAGIVERHGGTVKVKSRLGKGSTFIIRLPGRSDGPGSNEAQREGGVLEDLDRG